MLETNICWKLYRNAEVASYANVPFFSIFKLPGVETLQCVAEYDAVLLCCRPASKIFEVQATPAKKNSSIIECALLASTGRSAKTRRYFRIDPRFDRVPLPRGVMLKAKIRRSHTARLCCCCCCCLLNDVGERKESKKRFKEWDQNIECSELFPVRKGRK